jgi:hypothetical protein
MSGPHFGSWHFDSLRFGMWHFGIWHCNLAPPLCLAIKNWPLLYGMNKVLTNLVFKCTVGSISSCWLMSYVSFYFVMIFHHAVRPIMSDVIEWYIRMPQLLKYIHLRHSVWVDYFVKSESSCFTIADHLAVEDACRVRALLPEDVEDGVEVGLARRLLVDDGQPSIHVAFVKFNTCCANV